MNRTLTCLGILYGLACLLSSPAQAQVTRIQQPIVQQFSAGTTVTVPDRGTALLGGISSGRTSSRRWGPFRRGSIYGQEFQSTTSSVSVYIHDFEAMDRMLLNSAPRVLRNPEVSDNSQHWQHQLFNRDDNRTAPDDAQRKSDSDAKRSRQNKAKRFYELGLKAEQKHATPNIAILHYRAAAKYGSLPAQTRLNELTSATQTVSSSSSD